MLGIIWVPGTGRFTPLAEASALGGFEPAGVGAAAAGTPGATADATGIDPADPAARFGEDGGAFEPIAFENAPRCEATLLTASGETCGAFGSPRPGVVEASSAGTDAGGGP